MDRPELHSEAPPCPRCGGGPSAYTGLPDLAGPVRWKLFRCPDCGHVHRVEVDEPAEGWG
ncbi:MAG TPA: hypothetical protein RMG48_16455 [Myxococcales bacterium LLY-WYZ-16_1]|nr:hypothetical protein [Myxococcales bacterium LLY-WYZ-16_1]